MRRLTLPLMLAMLGLSSVAHADDRQEIYLVQLHKAKINTTRGTADNDSVHFEVSLFDTVNSVRHQDWPVDETNLPNVLGGDWLGLGDANLRPQLAQEFSSEVTMHSTDNLDVEYWFIDQLADRADPNKAQRDFVDVAGKIKDIVDAGADLVDSIGEPDAIAVATVVQTVVDVAADIIDFIFGGSSGPVDCDGLVLTDKLSFSAADLLQKTTAAGGTLVLTKKYNNVASPGGCGGPDTDVYLTITHSGSLVDFANDPTPLGRMPAAGARPALWNGAWGDSPWLASSRLVVNASTYVPPVQVIHLPLRTLSTRSPLLLDSTTTTKLNNNIPPVSPNHSFDVSEKDSAGVSVVAFHDDNRVTHVERIDPAYVADRWPAKYIIFHSLGLFGGVSTAPISSSVAASSTLGSLPGVPEGQLADTVHLDSNVTLRLYELVNGQRNVVGYRIRYTRVDGNGALLTDIMLQPSARTPQ